MELKKVLIGLEGLKAKGNLDVEINNLDSNSKNIKEGDMFVAIKGFSTDGHKYINNAIKAGAKVVMVEEGADLSSIELPDDVTLIMAKDTREALAICSCNFYENPSKKFKLIGVTGTKGKTTTTFMIKEILEKAGHKVGLIGTIATYINGRMVSESSRTTPESIELQKTFAQMVEDGVEYVVMEVSSQSLKLHRVDGCAFDIVLFTNFSEDHISEKEHPNMQDYFESKLKLFKMCDNGIINVDDIQVAKIPKLFPESKIMTYGIDNYCEVLAKDITITNSYVDFRVKISDRNERVKVDIPGRFSVYNSLASICIAQKYGVDPEIIKQALVEVRVPGRSEMVDNKLELPIVIHSRDAFIDTIDIIKNHKVNKTGVFHCCQQNQELVKQALQLGYYISFAGPITFKNSKNAPAIIDMVPLDKMLIETDSPYLSPEPHRGQRNDCRNVKYVAQKIADLKGISLEEIAKQTYENAMKIFEIDK